MKSWQLMLAAVGLVLCSCGRDTRPVLHIYNWSDYMNPDVLARFEQENNCRVILDNYDSNEAMYAKIKAGATGYDLIFPSSYMVSIMNQQGMIQPIDHAKIPNIQYIDPDFLHLTDDPEMHHSVPYMVSVAGLAYNKTRIPDAAPSWDMLNREDLAGRITLLDDMREVIGAALKTKGYSLNTTNEQELLEAVEVINNWKKNVAKFEADEYQQGIASEEFLLCHGYNGDVMQIMAENDNIGFLLPKEGASISSDDMVIPADAREVDLAHKFINFIHQPDVSAENMEYVYYYSPNTEAVKLVSEELRNNPTVFLSKEDMKNCEIIKDLGEGNRFYA